MRYLIMRCVSKYGVIKKHIVVDIQFFFSSDSLPNSHKIFISWIIWLTGREDRQTDSKLTQIIHIMNYLTYRAINKQTVGREDRQTNRTMDRLTGDGQTVGVSHFSKLTPFFCQEKILDTFLLPKKIFFLSSKINRKKRRKINLG